MNPDAKCEDCRYWNQLDKEKTTSDGTPIVYSTLTPYGQCRFNPPKDIEGQIGHPNQFPLTNPDDWCGKFESKNQKQESTGPK